MVDTSDEWIATRTGIRQRRIARPDEATSDMGAIAAERALETCRCGCRRRRHDHRRHMYPGYAIS